MTKASFLQTRATRAKIGYPDYLQSDDVTKLEKDYAEVRYRMIIYLSSEFQI